MNSFTLVDPILFWLDPIAALILCYAFVQHKMHTRMNRWMRIGFALCVVGLFFQGIVSGVRFFGLPNGNLIWLWSLKDWGIIALCIGWFTARNEFQLNPKTS